MLASSVHVESPPPPALVGAGGIGKTFITLTNLRHDRIEKRFGGNLRFIRCNQFTASRLNLLGRLSKVIGAGVGNPEGLTPLRPFLSSRGISTLVEDFLSRIDNIYLNIISHISTVPPHYKRPIVPALSNESVCDILYCIYGSGRQFKTTSDLVRQLDSRAPSTTLRVLTTTSYHNMWLPPTP